MVDHHTDFWVRLHALALDLETAEPSEWFEMVNRLQAEYAKYPKATREELQRGLGVLLDRLNELSHQMR
jgi:hypothetical protein